MTGPVGADVPPPPPHAAKSARLTEKASTLRQMLVEAAAWNMVESLLV